MVQYFFKIKIVKCEPRYNDNDYILDFYEISSEEDDMQSNSNINEYSMDNFFLLNYEDIPNRKDEYDTQRSYLFGKNEQQEKWNFSILGHYDENDDKNNQQSPTINLNELSSINNNPDENKKDYKDHDQSISSLKLDGILSLLIF